MLLIVIVFIFIGILFFLTKKGNRWIKYGNYRRSKHLTINQHKYYLEEVEFINYHKALHNYFKIVADIAKYGEVLEVKYDFYDWSSSIYRFSDTTIKIVRCIEKVNLIKSKYPISIEDFEIDNPGFTK